MTALYATAVILICTAAAGIIGAAINTIRPRLPTPSPGDP